MSQVGFHALALIALLVSMVVPSCAATPPKSSSVTSMTTAELANRYRGYCKEMREGSDEERARLRDWRGPMHEVMAELGERLGSGRHTSKEVIALLGPPDKEISAAPDRGVGLFSKGETHLVYWWRGGHDYLYFTVIDGTAVSADWYMALE